MLWLGAWHWSDLQDPNTNPNGRSDKWVVLLLLTLVCVFKCHHYIDHVDLKRKTILVQQTFQSDYFPEPPERPGVNMCGHHFFCCLKHTMKFWTTKASCPLTGRLDFHHVNKASHVRFQMADNPPRRSLGYSKSKHQAIRHSWFFFRYVKECFVMEVKFSKIC